MDYPVKTLSQLRPILQGFRKAANLTQAMMASHLGVTQQTYARLEANPETASVERLFKVLRVLNVDLMLTQSTEPRAAISDDRKIDPASSPTKQPPVNNSSKKTTKQTTARKVTRATGQRTERAATKKRENW